MKYKLIMFDMDGTLLPMDQDTFVKGYLSLLSRDIVSYIDPKLFINALWAGVKAMGESNGECSNEDAFWNKFISMTGLNREEIQKVCDKFYGEGFKGAKAFTGDNALAKDAVKLAHEKADYVVLATNPLFPLIAQKTRLSFIDLDSSDFDFITAYEYQNYIKPDTRYYSEILKKYDVKASECLMIGNDENEDAYPCSKLGIDCYIVTDCIIQSDKHPYEGKKGTFKDLIEYLKGLD